MMILMLYSLEWLTTKQKNWENSVKQFSQNSIHILTFQILFIFLSYYWQPAIVWSNRASEYSVENQSLLGSHASSKNIALVLASPNSKFSTHGIFQYIWLNPLCFDTLSFKPTFACIWEFQSRPSGFSYLFQRLKTPGHWLNK